MAKLNDLLVVSDVDGTLLQAGYGIPEHNINAIERFVEKGGRFTICTGRSVDSVRRYIDWIQLTAPAILNNGTLIYDYRREKVLYNVTLDERFIRIIKEVFATFPDVGIELHSTAGITVLRATDSTHKHTAVEHIPYVLANIDTVKGKFNKALFAAEPHKLQSVVKFIDGRRASDPLYQEFNFVYSSEVYYELIPKGINKGTGLKKLAELMRVELKDTVAIGDYYNDIELFEAAGYTAAVADAPADIRAKVDVTVAGCLQGGVGELLDSLESLCEGFEQLKLQF